MLEKTSQKCAEITLRRIGLPGLVALMAIAPNAAAQNTTALEGLLARADSVNPSISAARERVTAARARIGPASAWADPMLMAGIVNLPLGSNPANSGHGGAPLPGDEMTMKMVGISQTIPYPGKLRLGREAAEREAEAAAATFQATRLAVARDVRSNYFELAFLDHAIGIAEQNQRVLSDVIRVTEAHFAVGSGDQADVLKARVDAARLGETASALIDQRRSTLAALNAALDAETGTPVSATIPQRIVRAAVDSNPSQIRFAGQSLGAQVEGSPIPPVSELQNMALKQNPTLRAAEAMVQAQTARLALAHKESRPDFDVSLQYGQRDYRPDMITALVSVPLPLHRGSRQAQDVAAARAELSALEADRQAQINSIKADIARVASDLERARTQLALYVKAILPQGSAAATSSLASYQSGKTDLLSVLTNQNTLFTYQTAYYRALADFAKSLAELEQLVGGEVLR